MPYISKSRREVLFGNDDASDVGELNYCITRLCLRYLNKHNSTRLSYSDFNAVIGVLECAKQELYRRMISPYEDTKIKEHGDVYP